MIKTIKQELIYFREMARGRFPLRYFLNYIKNRYFGLFLLRRLPKFEYECSDNFEVHVLTQKSGLWMLAWGLRSFLHHSGLRPKLVIHSDGSIDEATARMYEGKFSHLRVILRKKADRVIDTRSDIPETIKRYRYGPNILILELTDIFLLARAEKVMLLDNDILFFKRPTEIVDFVKGDTAHNALVTRFEKGTELMVNDDYIRRHHLLEKEAHKVISGIIVYKRDHLSLEQFIEYFEHTLDPANHYIEQAGWAALVCQTDFRWLTEDRYPVKGFSREHTVAKHFTGPRRYQLYAYGLDDIRKSLSPSYGHKNI